MCLAIIAYRSFPSWPLIVAANRDEYHSRASLPAQPWAQEPNIIGGRDLLAGGTWLGVNRNGHWALLTNHRDPNRQNPDAPSRGELTQAFLRTTDSSTQFVSSIHSEIDRYNGFNLLAGDLTDLWYVSNRSGMSPAKMAPSIFGISNAELDTPWPKLVITKQKVAEHLSKTTQPIPEALFEILNNRQAAADALLPLTGVGLTRERMLSSPFIVNETYGTRCSTLLMYREDGMIFLHERSFGSMGQTLDTVTWEIDTKTI